jgi:hypothetical protein
MVQLRRPPAALARNGIRRGVGTSFLRTSILNAVRLETSAGFGRRSMRATRSTTSESIPPGLSEARSMRSNNES